MFTIVDTQGPSGGPREIDAFSASMKPKPHLRLQQFRIFVARESLRGFSADFQAFAGLTGSAALWHKIETGAQFPSCLHAVWLERFMCAQRWRPGLRELGAVAITPYDWADAESALRSP